MSTYAKGVALGIIEPKPDLVRERGEQLAEGEELQFDLLGHAVPVFCTPDLRVVSKGKPGYPAQVEKYLAGKFGDRLGAARQAMAELATAAHLTLHLVAEVLEEAFDRARGRG